MKRVSLFACALSLLVSTHVEARPLFQPAPLASFDGRSWSGLVLGQTTFKQLRPHFETKGGDFERSTVLELPKNCGLCVNCLWNKRGKDEVLSAITLRYSRFTPSQEQLERAFDPTASEGEAIYRRGRFEDWRVVRFPRRGVTAFQLRSGDVYATPLLVLSAPTSLARLSQTLVDEETGVERFVDPHEGESKIGEFGEVSVDFEGREAADVPERVRFHIEDNLHEASAGGTLRWIRGGAGFYKMSVSASRAKDGESGSFSVSTQIEAHGPYGTIRVTGSGSQRWKREDEDLPRTPASAFERAVREARRDAESKFQRAMLASGPPSLGSLRETQWLQLVSALRAEEIAFPANVAIVGF